MFPSIEEIKQAISNPKNLSVPGLAGYSPVPGLLGPEQYAGGFSVVFPFTNGQYKKALRVWHKEIPEIKKRTSVISSYISSLKNVPYFVSYEYVNNGIKFDSGLTQDVVMMDWIEGLTLKDFIDSLIHSKLDNNKKKNELNKLFASFLKMFMNLHEYKISHGDLQHGNIIVKDVEHLTLIDYDSLYVPTMGVSTPQITAGISGYQHPLRKSNTTANERNDYFSELIILTSILALSEDISVWDDMSLMDDDYSFVFNEKDYHTFEHSTIFQRLNRGSVALSSLLKEISIYLKAKTIQEIEPIEKILQRLGLDTLISNESCYCIKCGYKFGYGDNYCIKCGTKRINV